MKDDAWIAKISMSASFSIMHFREFLELWTSLRNFQLQEGIEDDITWKHSASGLYSAASAYKAQFLGLTRSPMLSTVWKAWAPPKIKFYAWLAMQNRVWTADRLAKRGWPNCGPCPLCQQVPESIDHILFKCRFTIRIWGMVKDWLQLVHVDTSTWPLIRSTKDWWIGLSDAYVPNRKAMASLAMLVSWTIWNERNARVFRHKSTTPMVIFLNIKKETALWVAAGARKLGEIMPRE